MHEAFPFAIGSLRTALVLFFAGLSSSGCADAWASEVGPELAPQDWAGSSPHIQLAARLHGTTLRQDEHFEGRSSLQLGAQCERAYPVPGEGVLSRIIAKIPLDEHGHRYELQIQVEREDLYENLGSSLVFAPTEGLSARLVGPSPQRRTETLKVTSGILELKEISGTDPEHPSVIPEGEGHFGGYIRIQLRNGEWIRGSFSLPCMKNILG